MIKWNFPSNGNGAINGISDAGIETFKGAPYKSLAREVCQNSLDACKDKDKPVKVEFDLFQIQSDNILGYKDLCSILTNCRDYWKENNYKKGIDFFEKSLKTINNDYVNVLRISDYNTLGLDVLIRKPIQIGAI